jgi:hypothetical protein
MVALTYAGSPTLPVHAGNYTVIGTVIDSNWQGSGTNTLVVNRGNGEVVLGGLTQYYAGNACPAAATTTPSGLTVNLTDKGNLFAPTNLGSYAVVGAIFDPNYQGSTTNTLVIQPVLPYVITQPTASQTVVVGTNAAGSSLDGHRSRPGTSNPPLDLAYRTCL